MPICRIEKLQCKLIVTNYAIKIKNKRYIDFINALSIGFKSNVISVVQLIKNIKISRVEYISDELNSI